MVNLSQTPFWILSFAWVTPTYWSSALMATNQKYPHGCSVDLNRVNPRVKMAQSEIEKQIHRQKKKLTRGSEPIP